MKRNWDCVRAILAELEKKPDTTSFVRPSEIKGWDEETVSYNMAMLADAGYLEAAVHRLHEAPVYAMGQNLTWEGHELLGKLRSEQVWHRVVRIARDAGLDLTTDVVKVLAGRVLEQIAKS